MPDTAVVFVHGLFSSAAVWDSFKNLLESDTELNDRLDCHCFQYPSPKGRFSFRRKVPNFNIIADSLARFLATRTKSYERIILVGHSQGGLIIQRMLSRKLSNGQGVELARIRSVACFATPTNGSEYLLILRKMVFFLTRQERELRPLSDDVAESQRRIIEGVVYAQGVSPISCPIPFTVFSGDSDAIVEHASSSWVFPNAYVIPGDHRTIVRPDSKDHSSYEALRDVLLEGMNVPFPLGSADAESAVVPAGIYDEIQVFDPIVVNVASRPTTFILHAGPVEELRAIDIIVCPENTYLCMAPFFRPSVSGRLRKAAARTTDAGAIVDDTAYDELILWVKNQGRFGQQVEVGTVAPTSAGMLSERGIKRIYHAALAIPVIGRSEYTVTASSVSTVVRNVFRIAQREITSGENLSSICFPLLGAGSGGLDPETSFERLWTSLQEEIRASPVDWTIHFLEWRVDVAEMLHRKLLDLRQS